MSERSTEERDGRETLEVEVRTPDGARGEFEVPATETVATLKNQAIAKFGIKPAPGVQFFLFLGGKKLPDNATLREAGVKDDAVLTLASEPQVGGRG